MIPQASNRREAEEFAAVIDGPSSVALADRYAELAHTVTLLREHPRPMPRPEFVRDLRERLLAAAEDDLAPAPLATVHALTPGRRRLAAAAAAAVFVGGTAGMAAAAQGTLPGDNLYPLKRGLEAIQLQLSTGDSARGRDLLSQADTRLREAQSLLAEPRSESRDAEVRSALNAATDDANQGAALMFSHYQSSRSPADISAVRSFAAEQMGLLGTLAGRGAPSLKGLGDALAAIDQQARVLCAGCSTLPPAALPANVLRLSSASTSFAPLVTLPTAEAKQLEQLARQAQHVADIAGQVTPPTGTPATPSGSTAPATGGSSPATPSRPVRDLLTGLVDANNDVPGQLATTVNGVTKTVTGLVTTTTGALTQTVTGLLGGLTTPTKK